MSKIENAAANLAPTARMLQDDEWEAVNGGFGFVERGIIINYWGDPNEISSQVVGR